MTKQLPKIPKLKAAKSDTCKSLKVFTKQVNLSLNHESMDTEARLETESLEDLNFVKSKEKKNIGSQGSLGEYESNHSRAGIIQPVVNENNCICCSSCATIIAAQNARIAKLVSGVLLRELSLLRKHSKHRQRQF